MAEVPIQTIDLAEPTFDPSLDQFVAVSGLTGLPSFGDTYTKCLLALAGADAVALAHAAKNPDEDPFTPDYLDLAAEEPTSQYRDSAEAAGYPGF